MSTMIHQFVRAGLLFGALLTVFAACDDISEVDEVLSKSNVPNTGAPVVNKIVMANDITGTPIESAAFTQVIRLEGQNLNNVTSIRFNDIEADMGEIYSKYDVVLAKIPRKLPKTVTDRVYITTSDGETSFPLKVTIPELKIQGLYCEYAEPGDTTTIPGNDYDLFGITAEDAVVMVGNVQASVIGATQDELTIHIPYRATKGDPITVMGSKMTAPVTIDYAKTPESFLFNLKKNSPSDWPGVGGFTHASKYSWAPANFLYSKFDAGKDDPQPLSDDGTYIRFKDDVGAWGWMVFWAGYIDLPADVGANPENYEMRFEFWNDNKYPLNSTYRVIFGTYQWYPGGNGVVLNTKNHWKTIRIPLDEQDPEGNVMVPKGTDTSTRYSFMIIFSPTAAQTYNLAMTNFRFVKK